MKYEEKIRMTDENEVWVTELPKAADSTTIPEAVATYRATYSGSLDEFETFMAIGMPYMTGAGWAELHKLDRPLTETEGSLVVQVAASAMQGGYLAHASADYELDEHDYETEEAFDEARKQREEDVVSMFEIGFLQGVKYFLDHGHSDVGFSATL